MPKNYKVIARKSRLNYDLNLDGIQTLSEVIKTLQEILDDLPKPKYNPKVNAYVNEEGLNIVLEEDAHIDER
ncbi:hypothetical protein COU57_03020 [Candidatus Pacearchaeota archaeon CG10_big_fil_rev_8_21_14_0_10_32_14]|nr:MAG: hypothetical protein COU57_03020 [Candidatus Pacearchaeota archaeon CG10_big_fil_rev_8_21_14_0_10_32_14]